MVRRLFVTGLSPFTTIETFREYFEQFGQLYECILPPVPRYEIFDFAPDDEQIETRSAIKYVPIDENREIDDDFDAERFNPEIHANFDDYMKKIGENEGFVRKKRKTSAGYGFVTFVDRESYEKCVGQHGGHEIDGVECSVEHARVEDDQFAADVVSKRLFVSFFPLDRLTEQELRQTFGGFGKITDVEFVSDQEGPLHFCIITYTSSEAVDNCLKKTFYVRNVRLFVRRAILREQLKIAEQKIRENAKIAASAPRSAQFIQIPRQPIRVNRNMPDPSTLQDPNSAYGYGHRQW
ncbi:unnamed protein product [Caenorhabditis bovis]|uniref:RRM domain-containing protein n=1 Tax=Caenorhabditis bovis TaxID=2654633 RepID=A0A8S1EHR0_9PELO|nr:unnamed protein product [Caenorhabditis bovis]